MPQLAQRAFAWGTTATHQEIGVRWYELVIASLANEAVRLQLDVGPDVIIEASTDAAAIAYVAAALAMTSGATRKDIVFAARAVSASYIGARIREAQDE